MKMPDTLEDLLKVLKAGNVLVYKCGDMLLQFSPEMPKFEAQADEAGIVAAGGWKRGPDLEND